MNSTEPSATALRRVLCGIPYFSTASLNAIFIKGESPRPLGFLRLGMETRRGEMRTGTLSLVPPWHSQGLVVKFLASFYGLPSRPTHPSRTGSSGSTPSPSA